MPEIRTFTIKISTDFHKMPMGRYDPIDGEYTGQKFLNDLLRPAYINYEKVIIDLNDLYGCPSSFREEAFGGLAREYGVENVLAKLEFISDDIPELIEIIKTDIKNSSNVSSLF